MLDLTNLEKKGAFISPELVKKTAVWKHVDKEAGDPKKGFIIEDEISFWVKQASWLEFKEAIDGIKLDERGKPLNNEALSVAACVRLGEDGTQRLTYEKVSKLETQLYYIFRNAVFEVYAPKG